jgi:hypothetical protein
MCQVIAIETATFRRCKISSISIPGKVKIMKKFCFRECSKLATVTFPEHCRLKVIQSFLFANTQLQRIDIPRGVTTICTNAFSGCSHLKSVIFERGSHLELIDDRAFESAISLLRVRVPSQARISREAFPSSCEILRYSEDCFSNEIHPRIEFCSSRFDTRESCFR